MRIRWTSITGILIAVLSGCGAQPSGDTPDIDTSALPPHFRELVDDTVSAIKRDNKDAASWGKLGMVFHALDNYANAEAFYDRAERLDPRRFDWAYLRGVAFESLGEDEAAVARFRRANRLDPGYVPAKLSLARLLVQQEKLQQGRRLFSELALEVRDEPKVFYEFGLLLKRLGESDKSIDMLRRAIRIEGRYAAAHYALADAYSSGGDRARASQHLSLFQAFGRDERPVKDPVLERVAALNDSETNLTKLGAMQLRRGAFEDAIDTFELLAARGSDEPSVYANLIGLNGELSRVEQAEAAFNKGLERIGPNVSLIQNLAILYLNARRYDDAEQAFRRAIELDPGAAKSWAGSGGTLANIRLSNEARQAYEKALSIDPDNRRTHWLLGLLFLQTQNAGEAVPHLEAATKTDGMSTARYLVDLATAYQENGRVDDARKALNRARQLADALGQQRLIAQIDERLRDGELAP